MDIQNLEDIDMAIQKEYEDIVQTARIVNDLFWNHRKEMLEVRTKGVTPLLGCRVDVRDASIRITWFYWSFFNSGGKVKRTNVHISKGKKSNSYSMSKLYAKALPNEIDMVNYCEQEFSKLRARSESLRKLKQIYFYYKKSTLGDDVEHYEEALKSKLDLQSSEEEKESGGFGEKD
ncbi:hypothetical protein JCM30760_26170 [Thiomicrorhabdus hydrogeniphila]